MTMESNDTPIEDTHDQPVVETATAVDEAAISASAGEDVPAVAGAEPAAEAHPTVAEAEAMFAENKGLSSVLTDRGVLTRDGVFIAVPEAIGA